MRLQHIPAALAAAVLVITFSAARRADAGDLDTIRVGYEGSLCEAPLHIAIEKGFFAEEGLEAEPVRLSPGGRFEAIATDKIHASFGLIATIIPPLVNGLPVKITTGLHTGCDKLLVPGDSPIKEFGDFRGKRIGVPSLTNSPIMFAKRVLASHGLKVGVQNSEVEFVVISNAELPLALERGVVDAISASDPVAAIAAHEYGLTVLADSARTEPYAGQYCCGAFVRSSLAETSPEIAAKYTRAVRKASAWIQENQDETARIQTERNYVAGDAAFNAGVLKSYNFVPSIQGAYEAFGIFAREMQTIEVLDASVDVDDLQKNSFAFFPDVKDTAAE